MLFSLAHDHALSPRPGLPHAELEHLQVHGLEHCGNRHHYLGRSHGIRCERGSHRFFKRYGERFEDSEGKQIFLEFAAEEREHLEMLIREYRALLRRQGKSKGIKGAHAAKGRQSSLAHGRASGRAVNAR